MEISVNSSLRHKLKIKLLCNSIILLLYRYPKALYLNTVIFAFLFYFSIWAYLQGMQEAYKSNNRCVDNENTQLNFIET